MSARYEWAKAMELPVEVVPPGTELGEFSTDDHALVLGDPWASAFVVEGTPAELEAVATRMVATIQHAEQSATADATRLLGRLRWDVETSSTMEAEDRDYVTQRLDEVVGLLAAAAVGRGERVVWRLTAADLDANAARTLSEDELGTIAGAIGNSSVSLSQ